MSRRGSLTVAIVAALIAVALGIFLSFEIHWFPVQASTQAHNTDRLYHVLVIATIPIFVLVVTVILYCVWQFRMKPGEELKDGPPIHGNTRLEVFWTATPRDAAARDGRLLVRGPARQRKEARARDPDRRHRPAVLLVLPVPAVGDRRSADRQLPAVPARATNRCTSTCAPRTSSTPSTSPPSACRRTSCPASRRTTWRRPTGSAATRSSATCCAGSGTR